LLGERDEVDRPAILSQLHHAQVDAAMRVEREIVGEQKLGGLRIGLIVEKDRAQDGAFGLRASGQSAIKTVVRVRNALLKAIVLQAIHGENRGKRGLNLENRRQSRLITEQKGKVLLTQRKINARLVPAIQAGLRGGMVAAARCPAAFACDSR